MRKRNCHGSMRLGSSSQIFAVRLLALLMITSGCSTTPSSHNRSVDYKKRAAQLSRELKRKNSLLEEIREANMVLSAKAKRAAVLVEGKSVQAAKPDEESVWQIPPGAFQENLSQQKRAADDRDSVWAANANAHAAAAAESSGSLGEGGEDRLPLSLPGKKTPGTTASDTVTPEPGGLDEVPLVKLPVARPKPVVGADGWVTPERADNASVLRANPQTGKQEQSHLRTNSSGDSGTDVSEERVESKSAVLSGDVAAQAEAVLVSEPSETSTSRKPVASEKAEHILYAKVLESYRRRHVEDLGRAVQLFLKTYPESVHADNALYLQALVAIERNDFTSARRRLDHLLRDYPNGNKAVSAWFARAVVHRHAKEWSAAKQILARVEKVYPGSPEALRVPLETRLIAKLERAGRKQ